jgi:hypothetical protein
MCSGGRLESIVFSVSRSNAEQFFLSIALVMRLKKLSIIGDKTLQASG